eukprot:5537834-Pyramimonas_sp.AAC.2
MRPVPVTGRPLAARHLAPLRPRAASIGMPGENASLWRHVGTCICGPAGHKTSARPRSGWVSQLAVDQGLSR